MHFRNPKCPHFFIQIVSGPLGIGDDLNIKPKELKLEGQSIRILTPTDCIRDRLSAYIHDGVQSLLDQAVLVAKRQPFEDRKIKKWLLADGHEDVYKEFKAKL
jgi:hypothetical protein